jgi:ABC-type transport system involved in multi-copper enzyme maturation permease subunit
VIAIVQRELLVGLRRGTPYALLAANALLLAALAVAVGAVAGTISPWTAPSIGSTSSVSPTGLGPTLVAWRGPVLFFVLTTWIAIVASATAPLGGARALSAERAAGTLDALIGSGVSPLAIVVGKALGAGLQVVLVLLSGAPAFALVWLFGGVSARVVLLATGLLLAYAAFLVVLGLLVGALLPGELPPAIVAGAVGGLLIVGALVGFAVALVSGAGKATGALALASPLVGLLSANRELAEALARAIPGLPSLPLRPTLEVAGRSIGAPLPFVSGLLYGALALALLSFAAALVDPYHPLKTARLRQRQS